MSMAFDHVSISVSDVPRSVQFYRDVLGLSELERPAFAFPGAWLQAETVPIHLTTGGTMRGPEAPLRPNDPHFAIAMTGDLDAFLDVLRRQRIRLYELENSPAATRQVFVMDPDGNVVELCAY